MKSTYKRLIQKKENKEKLTLTISKDAIKKGKETAKELKKSLSQFTEDMYIDLNENFFGLSKNPEERLKHFEKQINEMTDLMQKDLKQKEEAKKKS